MLTKKIINTQRRLLSNRPLAVKKNGLLIQLSYYICTKKLSIVTKMKNFLYLISIVYVLICNSCGKDMENVKTYPIEKSSVDLSDCYVGQIHTFNIDSIDEINMEFLRDMLNNHVFIPIMSRPGNDSFKDLDIQTVVVSKEDLPSGGFRANDTVFFKIQKIMSAFPSDIHDGLYIYHDTTFLCSITICSIRAFQEE